MTQPWLIQAVFTPQPLFLKNKIIYIYRIAAVILDETLCQSYHRTLCSLKLAILVKRQSAVVQWQSTDQWLVLNSYYTWNYGKRTLVTHFLRVVSFVHASALVCLFSVWGLVSAAFSSMTLTHWSITFSAPVWRCRAAALWDAFVSYANFSRIDFVSLLKTGFSLLSCCLWLLFPQLLETILI